MGDNSAEILFQNALVSSSGMCRYVHSLVLSIQHFFCRLRRRPPSKGAMKDGLGEAVVACDMPESYKFPSLDTESVLSRDSLAKRILMSASEVPLRGRKRSPPQKKEKKKKRICLHR